MPRQIIPVTDVASILLTQDEGDLRYLPIGYTPPPTDLSNYWTKSQSDALYAPVAHNHDATYLKPADAAAAYLPLVGGTLTGSLTLNPAAAASALLQFRVGSDTQPKMRLSGGTTPGLSFGPGGATAVDVSITRPASPAFTLQVAANLQPSGTAWDLGTSALRWQKLWVGDIDATGSGGLTMRPGNDGLVTYVSDGMFTKAAPADTQIKSYYNDTGWGYGVGGSTPVDVWLARVGVGAAQMAGNLGVGVTPAPWDSNYRVVQVGSTGSLYDVSGNTQLANNCYEQGGSNRALTTGPGSKFVLTGGALYYYTLSSAGAGAVMSYSPRLVIDTGGTTNLTADPTAGGAGGTAISTNNNVMMGQNQINIWHPSYRVIGFPNQAIYCNAASANTLEMGCNSYVGVDGSRHALVGTLAASLLQFQSNSLLFWQMAQVATGAVQAPVVRFQIDGTGQLLSSHNGGGIFSLSQGGSSNVRVQNTVGNIEMAAGGTYWHPAVDNSLYLGYTSLRFIYVAAVQGTIQTSHVTTKKNLTLLDPDACVRAVLDTDWVAFEYIPPPVPAPKAGETTQQRMKVLDEYTARAKETVVTRKQHGYVLGSPNHKVSDMFGLADRENTSVAADLGVLACALQSALKRIAVLEGAAA